MSSPVALDRHSRTGPHRPDDVERDAMASATKVIHLPHAARRSRDLSFAPRELGETGLRGCCTAPTVYLMRVMPPEGAANDRPTGRQCGPDNRRGHTERPPDGLRG